MKNMSLFQLNEKLSAYPISEKMRYGIMSFVVGRVVPFLSTAGLKISHCDAKQVSLRLANRRKIQNHMGTIHASAISLLAEATSGLLLNMNLPGRAKYSTLRTHAHYLEIARGDIVAKAALSEQDQRTVQTVDKGCIEIAVSVMDSRSVVVGEFSCEWSWKK